MVLFAILKKMAIFAPEIQSGLRHRADPMYDAKINNPNIHTMKRLSILLLLTIAFGLGVQAQVARSASPSDARQVSFISFNIRYNSWNNIDGVNGWPNRRAAVVRMINEERPAAIGLQEALIDQLLYLDSNLPGYRRVGVGRDDGKKGGEFMAIYYDTSRLEYRGCDTWWLSETPYQPSLGWDAACRRTVNLAPLAGPPKR